MQELGKLLIGESTEEIIACDLTKEQENTKPCLPPSPQQKRNRIMSAVICWKTKDTNEEHIDWLETQQELIGKIGLPNYLQTAAQED